MHIAPTHPRKVLVMAATTRTGFHRYTFPESEDARILIDLAIPAEMRGTDLGPGDRRPR